MRNEISNACNSQDKCSCVLKCIKKQISETNGLQVLSVSDERTYLKRSSSTMWIMFNLLVFLLYCRIFYRFYCFLKPSELQLRPSQHVSSQWGRYVLCFYVTQSQDGSQYPFHCHTITEAQNSITYYKHPRISTNIHSSLTALTKLQNSKQLCGGWDSIFSHLFNSLG